MTDKRLDEILKQALAPEISDEEIKIREKERNHVMKTTVKAFVSAAACLTLAAAVGIGSRCLRPNGTSGGDAGADDNMFALTAYAEELTPEKEVPVVIGNEQSWVLSGDKRSGEISYNIAAFFHCDGNNIDSITYSISKGAFQITEIPEQSIIIDAKDCEGEMNVGAIGCAEDEYGTIITQSRFVTEYTLAYDEQSGDTTWFSICGMKNSPELLDILWPENGEHSEAAAAEAYTRLVDGVEITCTAHFTDGTSASKIITVEGKLLSYEEAGIDRDAYGEAASDEKSAFFIFCAK